MADINEGPLIPEQTKRAVIVLANLFLYSVAMFTLPFVAFFGVRHYTAELYPVGSFTPTIWAVVAAVVTCNLVIVAYVYKAYYEKEYDDDGNEIDQHKYEPLPVHTEKSSLNQKQD